jgi:hypothetical protein
MPRRGETTHTRGYLPHIVKPGATYFVTFRLADSLPQSILADLEAELQTLCSADIPICAFAAHPKKAAEIIYFLLPFPSISDSQTPYPGLKGRLDKPNAKTKKS